MRAHRGHHLRVKDLDRDDIAELLAALGELLGSRGQRYELVLVGGASLLLRGVISRPTRDADVVAGRRGGHVVPMPHLPEDLDRAVRAVAEAYGVAPNWLNTGPQTLMDLGLPDGFETRLDRRDFPPGRHLQDLRALAPDPADLRAAARWARDHDPSPGFRDVQLAPVLGELGVRFDVDR